MALLLQSWLVLTAGLLTVLVVVMGTQALVRLVRRPRAAAALAAPVARPALRLVHSAA